MTEITVTIREERPGDHDSVREIHQAAFSGPEEAALVDALRGDVEPIVSLVAERGAGAVVGHILFTPVSVDADAHPLRFGLAPVGVLPPHQGLGVGAALIEAGLDRCRELGAVGVVLLGDPAYYSRFGFVAAATFGLTSKYAIGSHAAAFQALELVAGGFAGVSPGAVDYHPAFDAV